jgi:hypothetical protein
VLAATLVYLKLPRAWVGKARAILAVGTATGGAPLDLNTWTFVQLSASVPRRLTEPNLD